MTKAEFLAALRSRLAGLPGEDTETFLDYYGEIIDDRIEDGLSEAEAVEALGSIDAVVGGILEETPLPRLVRAKVAPRRALRIWEIVLLVLGADAPRLDLPEAREWSALAPAGEQTAQAIAARLLQETLLDAAFAPGQWVI